MKESIKLQGQAKKLGFRFERQDWTSEDVIYNDAGNVCGETKEKTWGIKISFPPDYTRPANWYYKGYTEKEICNTLQHAINEYLNREEIYKENRTRSKANVKAISNLARMLEDSNKN